MINISNVPYEFPDIYVSPALSPPLILRPYPLLTIEDQLDIKIDGSIDLTRIIRYDPPSIVLRSNLSDFFENETEVVLIKIPTNVGYILRDVTVNDERIDDFNIQNEIYKEYHNEYYNDRLCERIIDFRTEIGYVLRIIKIDPNKPNIIRLRAYIPPPVKTVISSKAFPFSQSIIPIYIDLPLHVGLSGKTVEETEDVLEKNVSLEENEYAKIYAQLFYKEVNKSNISWIRGMVGGIILSSGAYYQSSINLPKEQTIRADGNSVIYVDKYYEDASICGHINDILSSPITVKEKNDINQNFQRDNTINSTLIQQNSNAFLQSSLIEIGDDPHTQHVVIWLWVMESFKLRLLFMFLIIFGLLIPLSNIYLREVSFKKFMEGWLAYIGIWLSSLFFSFESIPDSLNFYFLLPIYSLFASIAIFPEILKSITFMKKISINVIRVFSLLVLVVLLIYLQI
ncbi:MAG: hypothetical protein O8C63_06790 [Candidatus Methanoperedens sp.]|nr:hypothetical protein [Candidatus Methanoperedens sp.]